MTEAPLLRTERLTLRPYRASDWDAVEAFFQSEAARYIGGRDGPVPIARLWNGFAADVGSWSLLGFGYWAVDDTATGAHIGQVGLSKPPFFPEREIVWIIFPASQRRGFGREAALAARVFAFGNLGWTTAVSYIDRENVASIALARSIGCVEDADAGRRDAADVVYRHPAPETRQ